MPREDASRYRPPDALLSPRYAGVKTFDRCPLVAAASVAFELLTLDVLAG